MNSRCFGGSQSSILLVALAACATPGARAHDMSAEHHEAAAAGHEAEAEAAQHAASNHPNARADRDHCLGSGVGSPITEGVFCWSSQSNPTEERLREAERHRRMAEDHRAASQALRRAESEACVGLRDSDRDMSPFAHREDIASVVPLNERVTGARQSSERHTGVVVTFRALPGMTAEWLQRVINCHLARNAALGHDVPEMEYCPLVANDVTARVASTGAGFAVTIRTENEASLREVDRRAALLTAPATPPAGR